MRLAIWENKKQFSDYILKLAGKIPTINQAGVTLYSDREWMETDIISRAESFDIALLSQNSDDEDVLRIATLLTRYMPQCQIIFITQSTQIHPEFYAVNHVHCFPKAQIEQYLPIAIAKAADALRNSNRQRLIVTSNSEKAIILTSDILYLERILRKTSIVFESGTVETYQAPQEIIGLISRHSFVRCYKSIYVQLERVIRLRTGELVLCNNVALPVGRTYQKQANEAFDALNS